jgi:hypothetical protein
MQQGLGWPLTCSARHSWRSRSWSEPSYGRARPVVWEGSSRGLPATCPDFAARVVWSSAAVPLSSANTWRAHKSGARAPHGVANPHHPLVRGTRPKGASMRASRRRALRRRACRWRREQICEGQVSSMVASIFGLVFSLLVIRALTRRRHEHFDVLPSEPLSTLYGALSKKRTKQERAALRAASDMLR